MKLLSNNSARFLFSVFQGTPATIFSVFQLYFVIMSSQSHKVIPFFYTRPILKYSLKNYCQTCAICCNITLSGLQYYVCRQNIRGTIWTPHSSSRARILLVALTGSDYFVASSYDSVASLTLRFVSNSTSNFICHMYHKKHYRSAAVNLI